MSDREMRAYLLGQAPPADAERLEARLLQDEGVYATLRGVEDDLFDECVRGALSPVDRERFLERYGAETDRLNFAGAFARRTAKPAVLPFTPRLAYRRWVPLAAAATLVLVVGGIMMRSRNLSDLASPARPTERLSTPAPSASVVPLVLGTSRAAGQPVVVTAPATAPVELRVALDPADRFDRYSIELRSSSNTVAWRGDDLRSSIHEGALMIVALVPASALGDGTYEIAVRGVRAAASPEDLGFVTLTVHRRP